MNITHEPNKLTTGILYDIDSFMMSCYKNKNIIPVEVLKVFNSSYPN